MTIRPIALVSALLALAAIPCAAQAPDVATAIDANGAAPQKIKIVDAQPVEEGEPGERRTTFVIVHSDQGACFAIAPPGGEGMVAGDGYVVVPASGVDDALKQKLAADHPKCTIVDVVARSVH